MGLSNAGLNFMYFIFILNLAISVVGAAYPQFSYVNTGTSPELNESLSKVDNLNPDNVGVFGAYDLARTFLTNVVSGNYYLWRSLGLDSVWAKALSTLTYLSYFIVMVAVVWGRSL